MRLTKAIGRWSRGRQVLAVSLVVGLAAWSAGAPARADVITVTSDLNFASAGQNMWGPGPAFKFDQTWTQFVFPFGSGGPKTVTGSVTIPPLIGTTVGATVTYDFSGKAGLEPRLQIDGGSVAVNYPIRLSAKLPDTVQAGQKFTIDTSSWTHLPSSLATTGATGRFTLDAVFDFKGSLGPASVTLTPPIGPGVTVPIPPIGPVDLSIKQTVIDIGPGSKPPAIPLGNFGDIQFTIPGQLNTFTNQLLPPPELVGLQSKGVGADKFLNLRADLDALAIAALNIAIAETGVQIPVDVLKKKIALGPGTSLEYELLGVDANLGLKLAQQFTFQSTSIGVVMTTSDGQVRTGLLGDVFEFTAPDQVGDLTIDAQFTLNGTLTNETGFQVNGSVTVQGGKLVLDTPFGTFSLADDVFGTGSDFLFQEEFPMGGLDLGSPIYLLNSTFGLGGFAAQKVQYQVSVIPEPSAFVLAGLGGVCLAALHLRRRLSRRPRVSSTSRPLACGFCAALPHISARRF